MASYLRARRAQSIGALVAAMIIATRSHDVPGACGGWGSAARWSAGSCVLTVC